MRKNSMFRILFAVLVILISFLAFYPSTFEQQIKAPMGVNKTLEHIIDAKRLAKWYLPFANGDSLKEIISVAPHQKVSLGDDYVEVTESNSINTWITSGSGSKTKNILLQLAPDNTEMDKTSVKLIYKTTFLRRILGTDQLGEAAQQSLENFAAYLENPKSIYGYNIQKALVTDTVFLFGVDTVYRNEKLKGTIALFEKLLNYTKEKNSGYNGVRIFYSQNLPDNRVALSAGIGVTRRVINDASEPFQYKGMPGGKNLLVTDFEGPYSEVSNIYKAQKQYVDEHKLTTMAIPFEKFMMEGFGFADSQVVKVRVCYPIH